MHLIKVSAINSTNSFARELLKENPHLPLTCVVAKKQTLGRGQRGTSWSAEDGKNLTFSVFLPRPNIDPAHQFVLSAAIATALISALEKFDLPRLKIKWPNDILSANRKLAGILIENIISEGKVTGSIIGIGLNVNQQNFEDLPQAGSMKTATGKEFSLEEVLNVVLAELEKGFSELSEESSEVILNTYKNALFRRLVPSTFKDPKGNLFTGMILDVSPTGKLLVQKGEEEEVAEYDLKEISLCY
ncbi:biotin--[acetyl-CoA-carboxylase] ligase [Salinimicrobium sp. MT39]|uniref:Biotin--[acetyl-CoA-carboxylase] ligase n=1 Tax=Salinimicrobium profundisediminis TaxID=2994553 RepID=A0A9X3I099_9FLAO|nr:biotin--[acetyl-CoA-carboxylase] ligase [Salinimicrobium profundisediminis]MCX2836707.1 biotin--[acetyl-CoA-carboxylase] ligase [Salinimicrobium profundisediminis]